MNPSEAAKQIVYDEWMKLARGESAEGALQAALQAVARVEALAAGGTLRELRSRVIDLIDRRDVLELIDAFLAVEQSTAVEQHKPDCEVAGDPRTVHQQRRWRDGRWLSSDPSAAITAQAQGCWLTARGRKLSEGRSSMIPDLTALVEKIKQQHAEASTIGFANAGKRKGVEAAGFCEALEWVIALLTADSSLAAGGTLRESALAEIEKQLDWLAKQSYGVDVREKFQSVNPVIDTVVSHSDAMHALLFVKQALLAVERGTQIDSSNLHERRSPDGDGQAQPNVCDGSLASTQALAGSEPADSHSFAVERGMAAEKVKL